MSKEGCPSLRFDLRVHRGGGGPTDLTQPERFNFFNIFSFQLLHFLELVLRSGGGGQTGLSIQCNVRAALTVIHLRYYVSYSWLCSEFLAAYKCEKFSAGSLIVSLFWNWVILTSVTGLEANAPPISWYQILNLLDHYFYHAAKLKRF